MSGWHGRSSGPGTGRPWMGHAPDSKQKQNESSLEENVFILGLKLFL